MYFLTEITESIISNNAIFNKIPSFHLVKNLVIKFAKVLSSFSLLAFQKYSCIYRFPGKSQRFSDHKNQSKMKQDFIF